MSLLRDITVGRAREFEALHWSIVPLYWLAVLVQAFALLLTGEPMLVLSTVVFAGLAGLLTWARGERRGWWGRRA